MDGNRRWARARGMPPVFGHQRGADAVRRTIESAIDLGIRYLTIYAFSSENWARPRGEVSELMNLLRIYLRRDIAKLHRNGVRVRVIGERDALDDDIRELIEAAEGRTRNNTRLDLIVALNYGSRREIVRMARRLAADVKAGTLAAEAIDEAAIAGRLDTAGIPDPDLLVRTSGEQRISNFLLWQLAYTELVFIPVAWPDFGDEQLRAAVAEFARRERRYGAAAG
ncbi:MAG: polyprenyl diphosphate synthase [Geminicoccaceae bacterium]